MITKDMFVHEILEIDDRFRKILSDYGMHCHECSGAKSETLEQAAKGHDVDFEKLLKELNSLKGQK
ncbi:MAG: DUF1858 domain-containing protein [Clostridiales bacterium]|nr:DUF1858 domain-containing protein [Clostridiales bacterium]